jgi:hypothetical protein
MKTLYVGCALRGAPKEFVDAVVALKGNLETVFSVLHFVGISPDAAARTVYETDISMAATADLMLAIADVPSTGLGLELAKRAELGRPTVVAYAQGADVSRMVLGLIEVTPTFSLFVYNDLAEVREQLRALA